MIQRPKRVITLNPKTCPVCQGEFQPASGAQRTCSPECKAKAKEMGLTATRSPRTSRGGVDPAVRAEVAQDTPELAPDQGEPKMKYFFNGQEVEGPDSEESLSLSGLPPEEPARRGRPRRSSDQNGATASPPAPQAECSDELELDLSPIERFIRAAVKKEVAMTLHGSLVVNASAEGLADTVREVVKEELARRLQGLIGS